EAAHLPRFTVDIFFMGMEMHACIGVLAENIYDQMRSRKIMKTSVGKSSQPVFIQIFINEMRPVVHVNKNVSWANGEVILELFGDPGNGFQTQTDGNFPNTCLLVAVYRSSMPFQIFYASIDLQPSPYRRGPTELKVQSALIVDFAHFVIG